MKFPSKSVASGHMAMLLFSLLVSGSFVLGSIIANLISPDLVTFLRFLIAFIAITILILYQSKFCFLKYLSIGRSLILGALISIYFITMFEGLKTASSTSMAVVFTLTPLLAGFFDLIFSNRVMSKKVWITVVVAAIGALWIIFDGNIQNFINFKVGYGEKLFFIGCICHALYAALIPKFNNGEPAIIQTFGTLISGIIILGLFSNKEIIYYSWIDFPVIVLLTILYLAIFATAASFFLIQYSAVRLSSIKVMAYTYAVPIWVVLLQIIFLQQLPNTITFVGAFVILVSLLILLFNDEG
jgi:drug/metabolite transporter (DMT)-like permease|tara:strand:- start:3401 stop:4297 length:897 start_codon:yes stop_codon:yes gene_type:complete